MGACMHVDMTVTCLNARYVAGWWTSGPVQQQRPGLDPAQPSADLKKIMKKLLRTQYSHVNSSSSCPEQESRHKIVFFCVG